jgi:hypothetical protein
VRELHLVFKEKPRKLLPALRRALTLPPLLLAVDDKLCEAYARFGKF